MKYLQKDIPYIQIVPMSGEVPDFNKGINQVQQDFFINQLGKSPLFYFNSGIKKDAPDNVLLLFKFKKYLIATAVLEKVEKNCRESEYGFNNRMVLKKDTIKIVEPPIPIEKIGELADIEESIVSGRVWNKISEPSYIKKVLDYVDPNLKESSIISINSTLNQFKNEFNKEGYLLNIIKQIRVENKKVDGVTYERREHKSLLDAVMMIILGYENVSTKNKTYIEHIAPQETTWEQNVAVWINNNGNTNTISVDNKEDIRNLDRDRVTLKMLSEEIRKFESINVKNIEAIKLCVNDIVEKINNMRVEKEEEIMGIQKDLDNILEQGNKQIIFTGAPGTGKTYNVKKYVENHIDGKEQYKFVQFHASYDYSDFVEGLRPVVIEGQENNSFVRLDGIFKEFCRHIIEESSKTLNYSGKKYYFIIDEINRADLSKVFGELMYGLEESYRGSENAFDTQYKNLHSYKVNESGKAVPIENDCFKDGFYIPENLIIIGTMNDIDRSVETFDFALRRRFVWRDIKANDVMESALLEMRKDEDNQYVLKLVSSAIEMNKVINKYSDLGLNESFNIGPAYFKNGSKQAIWDTKVQPILYEYCRGRKSERVADFINDCKKAFFDVKSDEEEKKINAVDGESSDETN